VASTNPIALVTGASSGIGEAISRLLVASQFQVIGAARNTSKLLTLKDELGSLFYPLKLDLNDTGSVAGLFDGLPTELQV
jgi:3-hydroxy acid dehydrogenase/malonic semialdehyde reductase